MCARNTWLRNVYLNYALKDEVYPRHHLGKDTTWSAGLQSHLKTTKMESSSLISEWGKSLFTQRLRNGGVMNVCDTPPDVATPSTVPSKSFSHFMIQPKILLWPQKYRRKLIIFIWFHRSKIDAIVIHYLSDCGPVSTFTHCSRPRWCNTQKQTTRFQQGGNLVGAVHWISLRCLLSSCPLPNFPWWGFESRGSQQWIFGERIDGFATCDVLWPWIYDSAFIHQNISFSQWRTCDVEYIT